MGTCASGAAVEGLRGRVRGKPSQAGRRAKFGAAEAGTATAYLVTLEGEVRDDTQSSSHQTP
jgi:hypothetical protein